MDVVVTGINGLVGRAVAAAFAAGGATVRGTGRDRRRFPADLAAAGVTFLEADRDDGSTLRAAVGAGADVVVDCLCYTAAHARALVACSGSFGSVVMISSKAVYVDPLGNHGNSDVSPAFDGPVSEDNPTVAPDWSGDYDSRAGYGANKVAAELVLRAADEPVTILRPSRIHGVGGGRPREWFFVRRVLDGRDRVPLAHGGLTANGPTAASNIAALAVACAADPQDRLLNVADPDAPTAAEIARAVTAACGRPLEVVGLPDDAPAGLGDSPWASWPPFLLDTTAADRVEGYRPQPYPVAVRAGVDWLCSLEPAARRRLDADPYFAGLFDYGLDDRGVAVGLWPDGASGAATQS